MDDDPDISRLDSANLLPSECEFEPGNPAIRIPSTHIPSDSTAAWAIGLLVGIDMVFGGSAVIAMALHAREINPRLAAPAH